MNKLGIWIRTALSAGAILKVEKIDRNSFKAMIEWPERGSLAVTDDTPDNALAGLNEAIQEDAADEMVEAGVV